MAELYVENTVDVVSRACDAVGVNEGYFWDWLGNHKFKEDGGNLTQARAQQIRRTISALLREYMQERKRNGTVNHIQAVQSIRVKAYQQERNGLMPLSR